MFSPLMNQQGREGVPQAVKFDPFNLGFFKRRHVITLNHVAVIDWLP
jgi:hypothetical protein